MIKKENSNVCVSNILLEAAAVAWPGHWQLGSDGPFQRATAELGRQQWGRAAALMMGFKHGLFATGPRPSARRSGWHKPVSDYAKQMTASLVWPPKGWFVQCANKQTRSGAVLWVPPHAHADICTDTSTTLALRAEKGQRTKAILGGVHALSNWLINTTPRPNYASQQSVVLQLALDGAAQYIRIYDGKRPCPNNIWAAAPKAELMTAISIIRSRGWGLSWHWAGHASKPSQLVAWQQGTQTAACISWSGTKRQG